MGQASHRGLMITLAILFTSWSLVSFAQTEDAEPADKPTRGTMKFNTESEPQKADPRAPLVFKTEPKGELKPQTYDNSSEDEGFKTYLGYPKHRFGANIGFNTVASNWTNKGDEYSFSANTIAYNVNYAFVMTPQISLGLDYNHYGLKVDSAQVTPLNQIFASSQDFDEYYAKFRYCSISSTNFYKQLCYGVDIGNSSYPILAYKTSNTGMELSKVQDIIVGLNLTGQTPFSVFVAKGILGFNYGTGLGSSGTLTPKSNYEIYATAQVEWFVDPNKQHDIILGFDYKNRNAKVSGKTSGGLEDTWETKLGVYGGRIGYAYMFP